MRFCSTTDREVRVTFREAVTRGISYDQGLFMPEKIPVHNQEFFKRLPGMSLPEIAYEVGGKFTGNEIPEATLRIICEEAFDFAIEIKQVSDVRYVLELFHGPTAAFKDFGARFMSQCLRYFAENDDRRTVILVATSGDTGGAIASSFLGIGGVDVIILYPAGKVSRLQEFQMTTPGNNITALAVEGAFDDCHSMVKEAFSRLGTNDRIRLTSANSINIARLIPQSFYYYYAISRIGPGRKVISVPSGNFGNLTGAVMAWKSGLDIEHLIASTNMNKVVPEYLRTGVYSPAASIRTIASAMDVGNPGNFERLLWIFKGDHKAMKAFVSGYWFDDEQIKEHISDEYHKSGYLLDPHGAAASLGLKRYLAGHHGCKGIFVETAHPAKFIDIVAPLIGNDPPMPDRLKDLLSGKKETVLMKSGYRYLEEYLQKRYNLE